MPTVPTPVFWFAWSAAVDAEHTHFNIRPGQKRSKIRPPKGCCSVLSFVFVEIRPIYIHVLDVCLPRDIVRRRSVGKMRACSR